VAAAVLAWGCPAVACTDYGGPGSALDMAPGFWEA